MSVSLELEITVKPKPSGVTTPATPVTGTPPKSVFSSKIDIVADTEGKLDIMIPGKAKCLDVYPQAGTQKWLKFFAISPTPPTTATPTAPAYYKGLTFACGDKVNLTKEFDLSSAVAYWGDALSPLFEGIDELERVSFTNPHACEIPVTIYFLRDAFKKQPAAPVCF